MSLPRRYFPSRWIRVAVAGAGVAGVVALALLALVLPPGQAVVFATLAALAVGGGIVALGAIDARVQAMEAALTESIVGRLAREGQQTRSLVNIRPLLGPLPMTWGGWAIDPVFAETLTRLAVQRRPSLIVECGSGSSTIVLAACVRALGSGHVVSLDHDAQYAERTRQRLVEEGLDQWATVVTAPLADRRVDGEPRRWYDVAPESLFERDSIQMLVVDGPPGWTADGARVPGARWPAVPVLRDSLADHCVIVMDDSDRPDERENAKRWAAMLGADLTYEPGVKGIQILERRTTHP